MNIGINASFLRKPATGIGQVTLGFLRALEACNMNHVACSMEHGTKDARHGACSKDKFFLYLEEGLDPALGLSFSQSFHEKVFVPPLYKRDDLIRKVLWEKFLLPQKVKKDACDVLLSLYQCPTVIKDKNKNTRHVMVVHDIIPSLFPQYRGNARKRIYQKLTERAIQKADHIIAVSEHTKKDIMRVLQVPSEKITVAHVSTNVGNANDTNAHECGTNDTNDEEVLAKYDLKPGYIYTGGGLEVRKNMEGAMRAYKEILGKFQILNSKSLSDRQTLYNFTGQAGNRQISNSEFLISNSKLPPLVISGRTMKGNPLATDVELLAKELDIEEQVQIVGFAPQEDLAALYRNALFFCFPSHYEGFGMPVLEAMTCGTPVLTANNSSIPEVGGDAALYCDDNDVGDIAAKMQMLIERQDLREELQEKGITQAQKFSWERFVEAVRGVL